MEVHFMDQLILKLQVLGKNKLQSKKALFNQRTFSSYDLCRTNNTRESVLFASKVEKSQHTLCLILVSPNAFHMNSKETFKCLISLSQKFFLRV